MRTLFVAHTVRGAAWYRSILPAVATGSDFHWRNTQGIVKAECQHEEHDLVVYYLPTQEHQLEEIRALKKQGVRVWANVDDYVRGIPMVESHAFRDTFDTQTVATHYEALGECDGIVVSTPWLAQRFMDEGFPRVRVAQNGLDTERYPVKPFIYPDSDLVVVGWQGGTGHNDEFLEVVPVLERLMREYPQVRFVSLGEPKSQLLDEELHERCQDQAWMQMDEYPLMLCQFDIGLAPSGDNDFYRAKSALRVMEHSMCGVPSVAYGPTYEPVKDDKGVLWSEGVEGFEGNLQRLIRVAAFRKHLAHQAHSHALRHYRVWDRVGEWEAVFDAAA